MPNSRIDSGKFVVFTPAGEALWPAVSMADARAMVAERGAVLSEGGWDAFPDYVAESFDFGAIRRYRTAEREVH
ncbi:hypothetical protein ACVCII_03910 [Burkholderia glumae]|uniref:hypothetical protein n=1 Tax=Burkholderia glumae TaxID=337 RepID=UPI002036E4D8|nr:hypothetical protein [Burkholderia glumae]MCM2546218.1 hypothetical protein [Burkholderia glumae]